MKTFVRALLVAGLLVACTHALPRQRRDLEASDSDEDKDFGQVVVLPAGMRDDSWPDTSFTSPVDVRFPTNYLDGFYETMAALRGYLRRQMFGILSPFAENTPNWNKLAEKGNTTSTTKVVDGHVVTINQTTYMEGDDENGTLIRVRIIEVKPQNETILMTESGQDADTTTVATAVTTGEQENTTGPRSVETVEEFDNSIPKGEVETLTA